ncbi:MAG: prolipoprotein diacylglyceryl transferase [Candidatus Krumholzibacteriia bacterium]
MHPVIFGFLKSYGLMLSLSFLLGILLCLRRGRARGLSDDLVMDFSFAVLVSSLVGVRLLYVLTHLGDFHPWYRAFYIWEGGLTLYGGILLATATVWWLARRRRVPFLVMADVMSPAVALGIGITRIGCFLNGCCFGLPTRLPWGVTFPAGSLPDRILGHVPLQPSQLYGSLGGFGVCGILLLWERRRSPAGATFARFLLLYGLVRYVEDFARWYERSARLAGDLTVNQGISLALALGGAALLLRLTRRAGAAGAD